MKKKKTVSEKDLNSQIKNLLEEYGFESEKISNIIDYINSLRAKTETKSKPYIINTGVNSENKNNLSYVHTKSASEKFDNTMGRGA